MTEPEMTSQSTNLKVTCITITKKQWWGYKFLNSIFLQTIVVAIAAASAFWVGFQQNEINKNIYQLSRLEILNLLVPNLSINYWTSDILTGTVATHIIESTKFGSIIISNTSPAATEVTAYKIIQEGGENGGSDCKNISMRLNPGDSVMVGSKIILNAVTTDKYPMSKFFNIEVATSNQLSEKYILSFVLIINGKDKTNWRILGKPNITQSDEVLCP